jgi:mannose-1-phosphate guanylyltransferase
MRPKQFLFFTENKTSLFQLTLKRLEGLLSPVNIHRPWLVANADHRFLVAEKCRSMDVDPLGILLEPVARNTALRQFRLLPLLLCMKRRKIQFYWSCPQTILLLM